MPSQSSLKLSRLKESCNSGVPSTGRLGMVLNEPCDRYSAKDVEFLEKWLFNSNEQTSILILKILCKFGNKISKYVDKFSCISSRMSMEIMRIAAQQNEPEIILNMVSEDRQNINNAVILLNQIGHKEYLTEFLFSKNNDLVDLIRNV